MARSLVLDPETDTQRLIGRILSGSGHEVVTFAEGDKALAWARSHPLDLAIVSLEPGPLSMRTWRLLKAGKKGLKVLILANVSTRDLARQAVAEGANGYLIKPIEVEQLESIVGSLLQELDTGKPRGG